MPVFRSQATPLAAAAALFAASLAQPVLAQQAAAPDSFELGTVYVIGSRQPADSQSSDQVASRLDIGSIRQANRENVGDALNLLSGITLSTNARNEKTIAVRGFDARQVPLYIDGIPVYVPYDGYVDFARFSTADLAAIQVTKGYSAMAYGANTLGGAINLVSRRPRQALEADARIGWASGQQKLASANLGSRQGIWYVQAGLAYDQSDSFPLASSFRPTATEDGGARNNAYRRDSKLSLKLGLLPGAGDEYALSYYQQHGVKGQPPSTDPAAARYWQWPYWDKESLYFISRTALGTHETLKLRAYHDNYGNEVDSYTNASYSILKTAGAGSVGSGRSIYSDWTTGAVLELESLRWQGHTLRLSAHEKRDRHEERDANASTLAIYKDSLRSYTLEDSIALAASWTLGLGAASNQLQPLTVYSTGNPYSLPQSKTAHDWQTGLFHDLDASSRLYATLAHKSRLPTLKDRYSQRLGSYIENPALQPEVATHSEIGYRAQFGSAASVQAALFNSDISNRIQSVANVVGNKAQMQNIGQVRMSGMELEGQYDWTSLLRLGASYTYLDLKNRSTPATRITDVPQQKLLLQVRLHPRGDTEFSAFSETNSSRWASNSVQLAGFTTLNLKAAYHANRQISVETGVNNLADRNYALADGFPSAGRQWFAQLSYQY
ncbi:TonB-dependent receptor plug domain-containing protein [Duganella qianjiadongensis]|uniref:TonB-dependent receptor n=1 Tax=Duganella qianjiadongensis TaxID=2692176 RepID=A0ABW9VHN2_9BURK|nr:TonB-dependent receptor [Duganella qianjiadongensis]MYM39134.1 TonB-dependent receptor [Duganella qianjiadongensis]